MSQFKYNILFVFLIISISESNAQSFINDFKKIKECYSRKDKQVSYEIKIRYYNMKDLDHPIDSMNGKYSLYGSKMNIFIGGVRSILNEDVYLTINQEEKIMLVGKNNVSKCNSTGVEMIDSLLQDSDFVVKSIQPHSAGTKAYRLIYNNETVDSSDIVFYKQTFFLHSMKIYYHSSDVFGQDKEYKPVVTMEFVNQKISDQPDLSLYSISNYISIVSNDKIIPALKYKDFEIFNHLKF